MTDITSGAMIDLVGTMYMSHPKRAEGPPEDVGEVSESTDVIEE